MTSFPYSHSGWLLSEASYCEVLTRDSHYPVDLDRTFLLQPVVISEELHLKPTLFVRGSAELHNKVVSIFFKCRRIIPTPSEDLHLKPTLFVRGTVELPNAKHNKSTLRLYVIENMAINDEQKVYHITTPPTRRRTRAVTMPAVSLVLTIDVLVLVSSIAAFLAIRDYQKRKGLPYPPGPRPLPLIGNLFDVPKEFSWLTYTRLSQKYGDVLSFQVFGKVIVVLNSLKANKDLLERRADIYSDRTVIPIIEMMEWDWMMGFSKCTDSWRLARKILDRSLRPATITKYHSLLETKANYLLTQVLASPGELEDHLTHLSGSFILAMGYGYEVKDPSDPKVKTARKLVQMTAETIHPGALLVNDLPFLKYIPESLSWLSYKPLTRYGQNMGQEALHGPMEFVKESILNGTAQPSLALENLQETEKLGGPERERVGGVIAGALGSMYLGGTDTTASTVMVFIVAALLHPGIQKMAQEELDAVTMRERLPVFEDRSRLPFVDAICKEVIRWRPITPLGIPHATTRSDVYEGFFIPKGAVMVMNIWAVLHDPVMYPEPDSFKPERFINPDGSLRDDPAVTSLFGFGKRICPGRHLADATIFIVIASLLSVFDIKKRDDSEEGPDVYPFTGSGVSRPCPFACSITPRDRKAEELILANSQVS